jgi:hypothetical protein
VVPIFSLNAYLRGHIESHPDVAVPSCVEPVTDLSGRERPTAPEVDTNWPILRERRRRRHKGEHSTQDEFPHKYSCLVVLNVAAGGMRSSLPPC